jgi:two-component system sensor histidine kinase AtoS
MNAAEATEATGTITIDATTTDARATLTIADNGPGIAPEIRDQIFEPFVTTKPRGTGLGLAIAQAIVDAHGGTIAISSSPESGTLVALQLPVVARAAVVS